MRFRSHTSRMVCTRPRGWLRSSGRFMRNTSANEWSEQVRDKARWEQSIAKISDEELWAAHSLLKQRLIAFIRHRSFHARLERGENIEYTESARKMFDPQALTIGFARRIAGYKRWSLLLKDPERLLRIINCRRSSGAICIRRQSASAGSGSETHPAADGPMEI